ncbi:MAG: DUF3048 domain-containing protein [Chloroflexi bacterium]|nr:DUF3048 domain-containing protein [Chloroflexota bacterium]
MQFLRGLTGGQRATGAVAAVVVLGAAIWLGLGLGSAPEPLPSPSETASPTASPPLSPNPSATPELATCPLSGLPLDDPSVVDRVAIAVQVENHPLARPARNLSNADMVVEAPVEGDVTRFSAIFLCRPTDGLTGPIRSARYYEVDLWQDLGILPVGYGASYGARSKFNAAGMPYVNGITGEWPWFQRAGGNAAPHNLYGDLETLRAAIGQGGPIDGLAALVHPLRPPFAFEVGVELPAGRPVSAFEMRTNSYWRFGWSVNADGGWTRQDAAKTVFDEVTDKPLTATSVVVQRVEEEVVFGDPDPGGNSRRLQHLVGEGDGTLYSQGKAIALHWSRPTANDGTTWTYADSGEPVVLPPGQVWWEIIAIAASLTES